MKRFLNLNVVKLVNFEFILIVLVAITSFWLVTAKNDQNEKFQKACESKQGTVVSSGDSWICAEKFKTIDISSESE